LEDMRLRFDVCVYGYVVMPEHVQLLLSEPAAFARDGSSRASQVSAQKAGERTWGTFHTFQLPISCHFVTWFKPPRCERDVLRKKYRPGRRARSGTRGRCQPEAQARKRRGRERRPCARA